MILWTRSNRLCSHLKVAERRREEKRYLILLCNQNWSTSCWTASNSWPELIFRQPAAVRFPDSTSSKQPDQLSPALLRPSSLIELSSLTIQPRSRSNQSPWSVFSTWPSRPSAERLRSRWIHKPRGTCRSCSSTSPSSSSACSSFTSSSCWAAEDGSDVHRESLAWLCCGRRFGWDMGFTHTDQISNKAIIPSPYISLTLFDNSCEGSWRSNKSMWKQ